MQQLPSAENEVGNILAYNEELRESPMLWYHGDIPSDLLDVSWIRLFLITFQFNLFSMELLTDHNTMFLTIKDKTKFAFIFLKNIYIPIFLFKDEQFKVLVY